MGARLAPPHVGSAAADWSRRRKGRGQSCEGPREPPRVWGRTGRDAAVAAVAPRGRGLRGVPPRPPPSFRGPPGAPARPRGAFLGPRGALGGAGGQGAAGAAPGRVQEEVGEAKEQQELPPDESRRRLGLLVGLMDSDASGAVSGAELRAWILRRHRGARNAELGHERARLDRDGDGAVTWDEFRAETFGESEDFQGSPDPESHRRLLDRSRRRFQAADADGDGRLRDPELDAFLHPEDFQHLQDLVAKETIEDLDRDGDGFIQVDEYIADLFEGPPGSPEPPEIRREREQFLRGRDRDGDGRLGPSEVKLWLSPPSPDWAKVEAQHLIHHADLDQDGSLSREEILGRWELFVGSRATDYGQDLHRHHDEL